MDDDSWLLELEQRREVMLKASKRPAACPDCSGTGEADPLGMFTCVDPPFCATCEGAGQYYQARYRCPQCGSWQAGERSRICIGCEIAND